MSIDKSTMKIFFEGMEGTFLSSGYSSKIIATPMGPFKWNDTRELWENVNNGMVMNNISFQDMMLMGYETLGGGGDRNETPDNIPVLSGSFGNINNVETARAQRFASLSGPQSTLSNATAVTITGINRPIFIQLSVTITIGNGISSARWSRNSTTVSTLYSTPFTVNNGDVLRIGATFPDTSGIPESSNGTISVINTSSGNTVLATIPWSYTI
jgi:hypothetical protein